MWIRRAFLTIFIFIASVCSTQAGELPEGFVYLRDVAPDIIQDMRYATRRNFMRQRLPGYGAGECVLTEQAADALAIIQADLNPLFTLVVFDCYRPQRAIDAMVAWVRQGKETDPEYHPNVPRSELIRQGYIGAKSSHARGSTVDLGFIVWTKYQIRDSVCDRREFQTVDFGTPFDCFDPASKTASKTVSQAAQDHRGTLVDLMRKGGFKNYPGEWWHFTLQNEPFPNRAFDFSITPR